MHNHAVVVGVRSTYSTSTLPLHLQYFLLVSCLAAPSFNYIPSIPFSTVPLFVSPLIMLLITAYLPNVVMRNRVAYFTIMLICSCAVPHIIFARLFVKWKYATSWQVGKVPKHVLISPGIRLVALLRALLLPAISLSCNANNAAPTLAQSTLVVRACGHCRRGAVVSATRFTS